MSKAVEQPDAADERPSKGRRSQLIRVFCGPEGGGRMRPQNDRLVVSIAIATLMIAGCVKRQAHLSARLAPIPNQTLPCTVRGLLFGKVRAATGVAAGQPVLLSVGILTPVNSPQAVHARVALQVACPGHSTLTTAERQVDLNSTDPPRVEFGDLTIPNEG